MKEAKIKTSIFIPVSLHEVLKRAANRNNRTLTREIAKRLIESEEQRQAEEDFPPLKPG